MTTRRMLVLVAVLALLAACSGDNGGGGTAPAPAAPAGDALDLKSVCPNPIVVQKDWQPESEHGFLYNLVGDGYKVDTEKKKVTGPLVAQGRPTGVNIEIRTGGPAVGFEPVPAVMYSDRSIHLGYVATDEAVQFSAKQPTTAVFAQMDISPLAIMWSPEKHPSFNIIADIGQSDTEVLYTKGLSYMEFLVGSGILKESQLNGSYDGSPALFVQSGGEDALQGFATSEPYLYQHEIKQWGKPLKFQLVNDAGFPVYFSAMSVRADDKAKLAPCLKKLVPILQRSQADFIAKPDHAINVILDLVKQYNTGWQYSKGLAEYSAKALKQEGIVGDGNNGYIGDFDMGRVQKVLQIMGPILAARKQTVKEGLKPEEIATNEFIDTKISLGHS
jgi:hypothetical protein